MPMRETIVDDAAALALSALAWTLSDDARAQRLLALTGIEADDLRQSLGEPATLDAALGFLEAHQPDLIACADALGVKPERLIAARERLGQC
jgi:Protein of unknown function (DUF3572)